MMMGVPSESETQKLAVAVELHVNEPSGFLPEISMEFQQMMGKMADMVN
jgi:hypothetical protein